MIVMRSLFIRRRGKSYLTIEGRQNYAGINVTVIMKCSIRGVH